MRKFISAFILPTLCAGSLCLLLSACGPAGNTAEPEKKTAAVTEEATPASQVYAMDMKPLTLEECGRCHSYQFKWLQDKGGKHQFECTNCHEVFHAYNPRLGNWDDIMPKCQNCHDLPHGEAFMACLDCHQQPHAPKVIEFSKLQKSAGATEGVVACAVCHNTVGTEFAKFPSLHNTEVNCQGCHAAVHGTIPSCLDCHDPHTKQMEYKDCLTCHSPHSASNIKKYPEDIPNNACGSCHGAVYSNLQENITKHSSLQCATCHASHGEIPTCQSCHDEPHGEGLHSRFTNCLDCHMDPHKLPVNMKK